jgi:delta 1-pyrroline-5-carboxylate dehydrogenase
MASGVPQAAVQPMPGRGETVGAQLSALSVQGIMFTGSTEVAKICKNCGEASEQNAKAFH